MQVSTARGRERWVGIGEFKRESDGRRFFTSDFKRAPVERIRSGAATVAEVSREFEVAPSPLHNWICPVERGSRTAVEAGEEAVALGRVAFILDPRVIRKILEHFRDVRAHAHGPPGTGAARPASGPALMPIVPTSGRARRSNAPHPRPHP